MRNNPLSLITLTFFLLLQTGLQAAERSLIIEPLQNGPLPVASTNFSIDGAALNQLFDEQLNAGMLLEGKVVNGQRRYITELLAAPNDAFTFQLQVPNNSALYGDTTGVTLPYAGYVFYPTTSANARVDYEVFAAPALPKMQLPGELPIFADETEKYPLLVYSHGVGDHPTGSKINLFVTLASHGYIVMALFHGDNRFALTDPEQFNLRPLTIKTALDTLLNSASFTGHIDENKIGGIGESYGGSAMLTLLGAKKLNPDTISVITNNLLSTAVDTRIKAAATIVPYAGQGLYPMFGNGQAGASAVTRPFLANSGKFDGETEISKVQEVFSKLAGPKYLVEYDNEGHEFSNGAFDDAHTWSKIFLDAYVKGDVEAISTLSMLSSVSANGSDTLTIVTEPEPEPTPTPDPDPTPTPDPASSATFVNNQLRIPGTVVGTEKYDVVLALTAETPNITFSLLSADTSTESGSAGSFSDGVLTVPLLSVGAVNYSATFALTSSDPIVFTLTAATDL